MIRKGDWKLVYYAGCVPQLFNLKEDPREIQDLAAQEATAAIQAGLETELRRIVDPEEINKMAFADQQCRIDELGGVDAIRARAEIGYTPAPKH